MNIKKVISMACAASLGLTMLASCGNNSTNGSTDSKSTAGGGEKTELTVYTNRTDRVDDGSLDKLTDSFEEANNCTVKYIGLTDYSTDIKTKMTTKDYGDVLMIPDDVKLAELKNYFVPLGTYDELKDTYQWINKKMDDTKTVYGIPYGGTATGILYNTKVWNDAGITELPKTPEEFIKDLKQIKEKEPDVVPYYTEYHDAWTIAQWDSLVLSAAGDPDYKNKTLLQDKKDLFDKDGGFYKTYKMLFDLYSTADVLEKDHATTDWEKSKQYFADGNIGSIVLGSWAISQFQEKAKGHEEDIGYMPVPITAADGKQYSQTSADYCMGVSKNSKNQDLAKKFVEWFVKDSGFAANEGMISTSVGSELPENLAAFKDVELFEESVTPDDLVGKFNEIDEKSDVGTSLDTSDNFKFKIVEAAFAGKGEDELQKIFDDCNKKWADARDSILK